MLTYLCTPSCVHRAFQKALNTGEQSGLSQWSMWRFTTGVYDCFTYFPFFLNEGLTDVAPCALHMAWLLSPGHNCHCHCWWWDPHKQNWGHLYTGSCLAYVHTLHVSALCKKAQVYKDAYDLGFCVLSVREETLVNDDGQRLTEMSAHQVHKKRAVKCFKKKQSTR